MKTKPVYDCRMLRDKNIITKIRNAILTCEVGTSNSVGGRFASSLVALLFEELRFETFPLSEH